MWFYVKPCVTDASAWDDQPLDDCGYVSWYSWSNMKNITGTSGWLIFHEIFSERPILSLVLIFHPSECDGSDENDESDASYNLGGYVTCP